MTRSYEEVAAPLRATKDPAVAAFQRAAEAHFEASYQATFGVGERLAARRNELHLSQTQLSEVTGIPQAEISKIECGKGNPTLTTLGRLLAPLHLVINLVPPHVP